MKRKFTSVALALCAITMASCGSKEKQDAGAAKTIKVSGSNTMAQVGTAWAENFTGAKVSVAGGGSGIGINELIEGRIDICTSSRPMKAEEKEKLKAKQGKEAMEFVVGIDALAVFVNPANPVTQISLEQLKAIYIADGEITTWEQGGTGRSDGEYRGPWP